MGGTKICLLLLLSTYTLAQQDVGTPDGSSSTCFLAKRFRNFKRFVYDYEVETLNGIKGSTPLQNGPKVSCKVEVEVPQSCSFILHTKDCSLTEVTAVDAQGTPVFRPSAGSEAFKVAMEKNTLMFSVDSENEVFLFPEGELKSILNAKRGIISALMVPAIDEDKSRSMTTVHGECATDFTVNSGDAADVTVSRDLSKCNNYSPQREYTSPLALISGMHYPLSKLIGSTQTCDYNFDAGKKHMVSAVCTEKHLFLPFSSENEYGISTTVKQTLTLRESNKINDRIFNFNKSNIQSLHMEATEDKALVQTKDAVLASLRDLSVLDQGTEGQRRAGLFYKLVTELRGLNAEVLADTTPEMMDMSTSLTWQALAQCGTPECTSAILTILRTFTPEAMEVDAVVYAIGLLPGSSALLLKDMLAMAQYKQSKPIMYALSNVVRKQYNSELRVTSEISAVAEFMNSILGTECSGEKDLTFLALRVVGNMGKAMEAADPTIKTTLLKCMRQPATTLSVQLAAIQAFRHMHLTDEVRANLQRVSGYAKGAVQKRLAAYLTLMRDPRSSDLEMVKKLLKQEQNKQVKAFVTSHIYNIVSSTDPRSEILAKRIMEVLQNTDVPTHTDYTTLSRNYKLGTAGEYMLTNTQGNMIFDPSSHLPREVMLETTMTVFGYTMDMWEVGMEGKGFEPSIEALFGKNGFFPDTISKAVYWTVDKMPFTTLKDNENKVPESLVKEVVANFNKLLKELRAQESPEAMAYLRILGTELGYIKASELKGIAEYAAMYSEVFMKLIPTKMMTSLISNTDNKLFAHYIFMDNKFRVSTGSGFPLKEVTFKPSMGIEFVTKMGVHVPEFIDTDIAMHTNMYHESALNARITMENNQVKLSIPAPQGSTQLFSISNNVLLVNNGRIDVITGREDGRIGNVMCRPLFSGVKLCTTFRSSTGGDIAAPYFPVIGENKFAVDIQSTGDVTEYTATIAYKLLTEGKGRQVDSVKMILKAEGSASTEASVNMKYNRNRNVFTTNVQIPDYDVETGIRVGMADSSSKGKSLTFDITNKNIPQLSLICRAKLQDQTDAMLQMQLLVPSMKTDASITATLKNSEVLALEIKSDVKLSETNSVQAVVFKYGMDQAEVSLMSNMNSNITMLKPYTEALQAWMELLTNEVMDQQVVKTDMKVRHIYTKALEAGNLWFDKIASDVPYVYTLRDSLAELEKPSMPENLFMNLESKFRYQFNKDRMTVTLALPLGGKTSQEFRIPRMLTTPQMSVPQMGLELSPMEISIPTFTIPSDYDLTMPLMGMMEVSGKLMSNYYNLEGMVSVGNNTIASPSYRANFKVMADSPMELLSFTSEGVAEMSDTPLDAMKAKAGDLKMTVDASHTAELVGPVAGTLANSVLAVVAPNELIFDTKNKANVKTIDVEAKLKCTKTSDTIAIIYNIILPVLSDTKAAQQLVRGRVYGRYLSAPSDDVEIVAMTISVVDQEKLSVQTTWNMEMPNEMMIGFKKAVPTFPSQEMVSNQIGKTYQTFTTKLATTLKAPIEEVKKQGGEMLKRASDNFREMDLSQMPTRVSESTMLVLRRYQKSIRVILDAAIKFLRETKFRMPGYTEKMSGLEIYSKMSTFVAKVAEDIIVKGPELFASTCMAGLERFRGLEFSFPGSSRIVKGNEILDDLVIAMKRIRGHVLAVVKKLGDIQLEDILKRLSVLINVSVEKAEELFNYVNTQNLESMSSWAINVRADVMNSNVLADITKHFVEARRIVMDYFYIVKTRCQDVLADMSVEQLQADIQYWIDIMVKRLNAFHNNVIEFLKMNTKTFEQYVRVSDKQMDIDIPFPFLLKN
ncbi:hypothetical protein NHX12_026535 [Muraenolepis orangiensis]|uniref:Vitellogenin domain-containing protein n=1 Tax=Muraenolepis orangiensis TaxID=630683 RepID=A0A9Q0EGP5_9TELE|nr:hypothetical protein NHX12_026535 [Muraenolepis orangiensis]